MAALVFWKSLLSFVLNTKHLINDDAPRNAVAYVFKEITVCLHVESYLYK